MRQVSNRKPVNPYTRLKDAARLYIAKLQHPDRRNMFYITAKQLEGGTFELSDVYERTRAAHQLGWDVQLVADEKGLRIQYVKQPPQQMPWELQ